MGLLKIAHASSLVLALAATSCTTTTEPQHAEKQTATQQAAEKPPQHAKRVQVTIYDSSTRPKTARLDVYDTNLPQRPYKEIALLTCEGAPAEEAAMMTAILYRARMMGADAVINAGTKHTQEGLGLILTTRCVFRANAIVYEKQ